MFLKKVILTRSLLFILLLNSITLSAQETNQTDNGTEIKELSKKLGIEISPQSEHILLFKESADWIGSRYRRGGSSKKGVDCSGFTGSVYKSVFNQNLARRSIDIASNVLENLDKKELKTGDLVFFATSGRKNTINHVGIYLKNDKFIHASVSKGVIVSSLNEPYYQRTWRKGGRVKTIKSENKENKMHFLPIPDLKNDILLLTPVKREISLTNINLIPIHI